MPVLWLYGARRSPETLFDAPVDTRAEELPLMLEVLPEGGAGLTLKFACVDDGKNAHNDCQKQQVSHSGGLFQLG